MLTISWCPCVESSLVLLEEGVCYDQCILLEETYSPLPCFILYSMAKSSCYSRSFLTSYLCIPFPYNEKDIFLGVVSSTWHGKKKKWGLWEVKISWEGFPGGSDGKESACNAKDPDSIPGLKTSPKDGNGSWQQFSCPDNPVNRGAWKATILGYSPQRVGHDCVTNIFIFF